MHQPYQLAIAVRYLRARSRNSFISFISAVSTIGIALAVAVLIIVLSVTNGFFFELQQRTLGMVADATISGFSGPLEDWNATREAALQRADIDAAAPYVEGQGMIFANDTLAGISLRGIDPVLESQVSAIESFMVNGAVESLQAGTYAILIGVRLANQLEVSVGDQVVVFLAQASMTPFGAIPRQRAFTIGGIFDSGMYEYDRGMVFTSIADASRLYRTAGRASGLRLSVSDIYSAGSTATALARELGGGFYVSDWSRQHAAFFRSIQISKVILAIILSMVICVAVFNIVSTLVMVVREKRGDIAILRSFGASARSILGLFAAQGSIIGVVGVSSGVAFGVLVAVNLGRIVALLEKILGTELFSGEAYLISELPSRVDSLEVAQIGLLALALAILATVYPAVTAARQPPAEALRNE